MDIDKILDRAIEIGTIIMIICICAMSIVMVILSIKIAHEIFLIK